MAPDVFKSRTGGRAFSFQAPLLWNQLPVWVQSDTLFTFKIRVQTFFFDKTSRAGPFDPEPSFSLGCCGISHDVLLNLFLLNLPLFTPDIHVYTLTPRINICLLSLVVCYLSCLPALIFSFVFFLLFIKFSLKLTCIVLQVLFKAEGQMSEGFL